MFLVNKEDKTTKEIKDISFKSCGLKEKTIYRNGYQTIQ